LKLTIGFSGFVAPDIYTGNATIKEIYSNVNSTSFTYIFDCVGCYFWNQTGNVGETDTSSGFLIPAWSQAWSSKSALIDPSNPDTSELGQHNAQGNFGIPVSAAVNSSYSSWFTKTKTATATATVTATNTATTTPYKSVSVPTGATFDYIVVGGGANGVPMADKVSETGKTTLLIERGPPSSGRWGGSKYS
jgi:cellobiose dehydrogenase (acceptor)